MSTEFKLSQIVTVDETLCVNCHMCISVCPIKYCNDGSGDVVQVNPDMCIACGACISACTHNARYYIDDFDLFIKDIIAGEKIVAIVAPAAAGSFPDQYLQLNTFLKELGVSAIFDVSFGAELTIKSYFEYIKNKGPQTVIAQPCPAIVNFIEIYKPELIKYLAPADSPALHTVKMIREYYEQYKDYKIAFISPCISKKHEFEETNSGVYNVTMKSIEKFLIENKVSLDTYDPSDFDNPPAERAVLFSSPGGLTKTLERWNPDAVDKTRKIEGKDLIYKYLDELPEIIYEGHSPLLIDCLSCEFGCNQGPGSLAMEQSPDTTEFYIKKRAQEQKEKYLSENENNTVKSKENIETIIDKYWEEDLYERKYVNRWKNNKISYPTQDQIDEIFKKMLKTSKEDIQNCASCGYGTCEGMAIAVFNKLNKVENCHLYRQKLADQNLIVAEKNKRNFENLIQTSLDGFIETNNDEIIINVNDALRKMLKKSDIIGRSLFEFLDEKNKKILLGHSKKRIKGEQSSYELEFLQSDGNKIITLVSASPLYEIETGKKIGSFASITDISLLKKQEVELLDAKKNLEVKVRRRTAQLSETLEELKQQKEELTVQSNALENMVEELNQQKEELFVQKDIIEDEKLKLNNILELLPNPALIIDKNGLVVFWNKAMENLTGVSASEMIGQGNHEYAIPFYGEPRSILIDLVTIDDDFLKKNYSSIIKNNNILTAETYVPQLKGEERYLIGHASALYDKDENYNGAIEIIEDYTDKHRQQEEIIEQKNQLLLVQQSMSETLEELQVSNEIINQINSELSQLSIVASETDNAIIIMDKDGNYEWVNKAFVDRFGFSESEITKFNILEVSKYPEIKEVFTNIVENKTSATFETIETSKSGDEFYTQTTLSPVLNDLFQITNIVAVKSDISELKKAEDELRKLSIVASETDNSVTIMNSEGDFEWVNKGFTKIFGYNLDELINAKGKNIKEGSEYEYIDEVFKEVIETKDSKTYTSIEHDKDNKIHYSQTTLTPIYGNNDELLNIIAVSSDITEIKQNEELLSNFSKQIETQRDELFEISEKIKQIILTLPDAAFVIDENGVIEYWNSALEEMTGVKAIDMIGKGDYEYSKAFYEERRPILIDLVRKETEDLEKNYTGIKKSGNILKAETYVPNLRGKERYLIGTATAMYDTENNYLGAIEIVHDITQRQYYLKQIEKQRQNIIQSINYAFHIQEALLPQLNILQHYFEDYFLFFKPRDIVSGDFYWTYFSKNKIIIVVADCTGHGVPGAMMSMLGISFLGQIIEEFGLIESSEILNKLRTLVISNLTKAKFEKETKDGMDMSLIIYDKDEMTVDYSGANNSIFVISDETYQFNGNAKRILSLDDTQKVLVETITNKMPIGSYIREDDFKNIKFNVKKGDRIYLYTDGYPDMFNKDNIQKFTKNRFKRLLLSTSEYRLNEQNDHLAKSYSQWIGKEKQTDDITVLGLQI